VHKEFHRGTAWAEYTGLKRRLKPNNGKFWTWWYGRWKRYATGGFAVSWNRTCDCR